MGRSHAVVAATGWLAAAPPAAAAGLGVDEPATLAASTLVAAGAGLLPDLDQPGASASRALGPASWLLAAGISAVAGGHRQATHSLAFVALVFAACWAGLHSGAGGAVAVGVSALCVGLVLRAAGPDQVRGGGWIDLTLLAWTAGLVWAGVHLIDTTGWLPWSAAFGTATHVLADLLTPEGVPLLWPWSARQSLPVIASTGNATEVALVGVVGCAGAWMAYDQLAPAVYTLV